MKLHYGLSGSLEQKPWGRYPVPHPVQLWFILRTCLVHAWAQKMPLVRRLTSSCRSKDLTLQR